MSLGGWGSDWPVQTTPNTYEQGVAEGERRATERIVAWLREVADTMDYNSDKCCGRVQDLAEAVERGEHRTAKAEE